MKTQENHKSKLHKGFEKQVKRQDAKLNEVCINLPISVKLPNNFNGDYIHCLTVSNNKWNGMNLKKLKNSFIIIRVGGMYGKFTINQEGKYKLSRHGKDILRRKKINQNL